MAFRLSQQSQTEMAHLTLYYPSTKVDAESLRDLCVFFLFNIICPVHSVVYLSTDLSVKYTHLLFNISEMFTEKKVISGTKHNRVRSAAVSVCQCVFVCTLFTSTAVCLRAVTFNTLIRPCGSAFVLSLNGGLSLSSAGLAG